MPGTTDDSSTERIAQQRTPTVTRAFDSAESPSTVVVQAVVEALDRDAHEVTPLHRSVDPDALDSLFATKHDGTPRTGGRVGFDHADCRVVVDGPKVAVFYRR